MQSTDQLLSRIDALLTNKASDLHLRVMDLLDNPTQKALMLDWDCETLEVTQQDLDEIAYIEVTAPRVFSNRFQAKRMSIECCVACDFGQATQQFKLLFCSPDCAQYEPWQGNLDSAKTYFEAFHAANPDLPQPLHASNLCVGPLFQLKNY